MREIFTMRSSDLLKLIEMEENGKPFNVGFHELSFKGTAAACLKDGWESDRFVCFNDEADITFYGFSMALDHFKMPYQYQYKFENDDVTYIERYDADVKETPTVLALNGEDGNPVLLASQCEKLVTLSPEKFKAEVTMYFLDPFYKYELMEN